MYLCVGGGITLSIARFNMFRLLVGHYQGVSITRTSDNHTYQGVLCSVLLTRYHSADQIKKTEMGRTCTHRGEVHAGF